MQIAKLFASLGFKVDLTEYNTFEKKLKDVRRETRNYAVSLKTIRTRLSNVGTALDGVNKKLNASKVKASNQRISTSANRLANAVEKSAKGLSSVITNGQRVHTVISQINTILGRGVNGWRHYNKQLDDAKSKLGAISASVRAIPSNKRISVNTTGSGAGGARVGAGRPSGGATATQMGAMGMLGLGARDFFRSMAPATAITGGLVTSGFAIKEVVSQGREMKQLDIVMKSATDGAEHLAESMKYVRSEAFRLGQDVYEMGMGFAKMQQSVRGKLSWEDRKALFTGFAELSTTYGLSKDAQAGIWRAMTQMFTKGKIQAEEEEQMAERGLPAREMVKLATKQMMEARGDKFDDAIYDKMRQKGEVKLQDIAPYLGKIASDIARNQGALDDALKTSLVGQMRMSNAIREASKTIMDAGLDRLLFDIFDTIRAGVPIIKDLIIILIDVARAFFDVIKAIKWFISEHPAAAAVIAALIVSLRLFRFGLWGAASAALLMGGSFRKALIMMATAAKRFLPFALLYGIWKLFKSFDRYMSGEENWITLMMLHFENLGLRFKILVTELQLGWYKLKNTMKDPPSFAGKVLPFLNPATSIGSRALRAGRSFSETANSAVDRNINPTNRPMIFNNETTVNVPNQPPIKTFDSKKIELGGWGNN